LTLWRVYVLILTPLFLLPILLQGFTDADADDDGGGLKHGDATNSTLGDSTVVSMP
jgi:hypothetical protein